MEENEFHGIAFACYHFNFSHVNSLLFLQRVRKGRSLLVINQNKWACISSPVTYSAIMETTEANEGPVEKVTESGSDKEESGTECLTAFIDTRFVKKVIKFTSVS